MRPHRVALWLGGLGSWGRIGSGCVPSHSFTWSLGTPYVGHLHRLTVNRGQMTFGVVWCILSTRSTIVCHWCNTLVLTWYGAGVVLVWFSPVSQLVENGCFWVIRGGDSFWDCCGISMGCAVRGCAVKARPFAPGSGSPERSDIRVQSVICGGIVQAQITGTRCLHQMRITA